MLNPPLYFYVCDPRVHSVRDAMEGKKNDYSWNEEMPKTAEDLYRRRFAYVYFTAISLFYTYWAFADFVTF